MNTGLYTVVTIKLDMASLMNATNNINPDTIMHFMDKWKISVSTAAKKMGAKWARLHSDTAQFIADNAANDEVVRKCVEDLKREIATFHLKGVSVPILVGISSGQVYWDDQIAFGPAVEASLKNVND